MTKNEAMLHSGVHLIAQADNGMQTVMIDKAIEQLQLIKFTRQNVPF